MQFFKGLSTYFVAGAMLAQVAYAFSGDGTFYYYQLSMLPRLTGYLSYVLQYWGTFASRRVFNAQGLIVFVYSWEAVVLLTKTLTS
jgi:hypothetical protein